MARVEVSAEYQWDDRGFVLGVTLHRTTFAW